MQDEEIDRMIRMVSEPLRIKWEQCRNGGQSLLELKKRRDTALIKEKSYKKMQHNIFLVMILGLMVSMFIPFTAMKEWISPILVCLFLFFIPMAVNVLYVARKQDKIPLEKKHCDEVFAKLSQSLAALNPRNVGEPSSGVIDADYVHKITFKLAVHVITDQQSFDELRKHPSIDRDTLIQQGHQVEKSEADFRNFSFVLQTDFDFLISRSKVFQDAQAHIDKRSRVGV